MKQNTLKIKGLYIFFELVVYYSFETYTSINVSEYKKAKTKFKMIKVFVCQQNLFTFWTINFVGYNFFATHKKSVTFQCYRQFKWKYCKFSKQSKNKKENKCVSKLFLFLWDIY